MREAWRQCWPLGVALVLVGAAIAALHLASVRIAPLCPVYPLDDAYIHMAVAEHWARDGTWGIEPGRFASVTSSPLWTLLLACGFRVAGVRDGMPLVLNVVFAVVAVALLDRMLVRRGIAPAPRLACVVSIAALTSIPVVALTGMEHTLQLVLTLVFAESVGAALAATPLAAPGGRVWLPAVAAALSAVRYEGLFLVAAAAVLLALRRRWGRAAAVALAGALPIGLYGLLAISHGWTFVPTSVLLKGRMPRFGSSAEVLATLGGGVTMLWKTPALAALLLAVLLLLTRTDGDRGVPARDRALAALFCGALLLHAQLAGVGSFHRYLASLFGLGLFVLAAAIAGWRARGGRMWNARRPIHSLALAVLALVLAAPVVHAGLASALQVPLATRNIHDQQIQMARFLRDYYSAVPVAVNDIGAVGYYRDGECVDLGGIATLAVARARLAGRFDAEVVEQLARDRGVAVAVLYDSWFRSLPPTWTRVGRWTIRDNVVCGSDTVSFYAVAPEEAARLAAHLEEFAASLPAGVAVGDGR